MALGDWSVTHAPAAATQATISRAAGGAGVRHVCTGITVSVAAAGTAQPAINANLRDGATGAGTILWSGVLAAPANGSAVIPITGLMIQGSYNTAMTLEFAAAGAAATIEAVSMSGYTTNT